jgi:translation initiation factor 5B
MQQKSKKGSKAKGTQSNIRTPIVVVMGHVDHGKTTLLDKIRGTTVADFEAGAITQHIGATEVPLEVIQDFCGAHFGAELQVPGLLFIDTPGHHAFTSLRSRGGSLADLAVLIVDANEGFQPQTIESLTILKRYKTPFVVAANKIDRISGWRATENASFAKSLKSQNERVTEVLDTRIYELVEGFTVRIRCRQIRPHPDFTKNIGIVPISAITGEGVPDLLMVLVGLAQRFLKDSLKITASGPGVGTILEVKEERGLGTTLDVILHDGELNAGDTVIVGTARDPVVTKIRALLKPKPLSEIRSEERFFPVKHVVAASGVKVAAPKLENALAGSTIRVVTSSEDAEAIGKEMKSELESVRIDTEQEGVILKADTIGSLEALVGELKSKSIPIHVADVGPISRRDVIRASSIKDPLFSAILAFNVDILPDALSEVQKTNVPVFSSNIIYSILENYEAWVEEQKMKMEQARLEAVIRPGAVRLLPDCVFRQSKPAIVGVQIIGGVDRTQTNLMREDGANVGAIKGIRRITRTSDPQLLARRLRSPSTAQQLAARSTKAIFSMSICQKSMLA